MNFYKLLAEAKKKKLDTVDKDELDGAHDEREDGDIDNDGDEDSSDKFLHKRRKAISKAIGKGKDKVDEEAEEHDEVSKASEKAQPKDKVSLKKAPREKKKETNEEVELDEGTWALPDNPDRKKQFVKIMSKPLKAKDAKSKLYNILGDDDFFDMLDDVERDDSKQDVRPAVKAFMKDHGYYKKFKIKEEVELEEKRKISPGMQALIDAGNKKADAVSKEVKGSTDRTFAAIVAKRKQKMAKEEVEELDEDTILNEQTAFTKPRVSKGDMDKVAENQAMMAKEKDEKAKKMKEEAENLVAQLAKHITNNPKY